MGSASYANYLPLDSLSSFFTVTFFLFICEGKIMGNGLSLPDKKANTSAILDINGLIILGVISCHMSGEGFSNNPSIPIVEATVIAAEKFPDSIFASILQGKDIPLLIFPSSQ